MELRELQEVLKERSELERLVEDHRFLVGLVTELAGKLGRKGKLLAGDRRIFQERPDGTCEYYDPDMPTLLELLQGYAEERANGRIPG